MKLRYLVATREDDASYAFGFYDPMSLPYIYMQAKLELHNYGLSSRHVVWSIEETP